MSFIEENQRENSRLHDALKRVNAENWRKDLGGGWTIGTMLCHLGFWDQMTLTRLKKWKTSGTLAPIPDAANIEAMNDSIRTMCGVIGFQDGCRLISDCANSIDSFVSKLDDAELKQLQDSGRERWFQRSRHRLIHLPRIESAL